MGDVEALITAVGMGRAHEDSDILRIWLLLNHIRSLTEAWEYNCTYDGKT